MSINLPSIISITGFILRIVPIIAFAVDNLPPATNENKFSHVNMSLDCFISLFILKVISAIDLLAFIISSNSYTSISLPYAD